MSSNGTAPPDPVTPQDHEAFITITGAILITWTVLVFAMRVYIRFRINGENNGYFGHDDSTFTLGTVLAIVQTAVTLTAVHNGLGKSEEILTPSESEFALQLVFAGSLLYILAICASKCSVSLLISRLTMIRHHRIASHALTAFAVAWAIVGLFVIGFGCDLSSSWDTVAGNCYNLLTRWIAIEAVSMFIELMLFTLSLYFAWDIQMLWNSKAVVVGAFACRLLIIIPTIFRLYYLSDAINGTDPTIDSVKSIITTQVVMHFSVMAATIPCIRPFLRAFDSGMGYSVRVKTTNGSELTSKYVEDSSYILHSIDRGEPRKPAQVRLRPDNVQSTTAVEFHQRGPHTAAASIGSDTSNQMIIRKTQEWEVVEEANDV